MKARLTLPLVVAAALALACNGATSSSNPVAPQIPLQATTAESNAGGALVFYDQGCAIFNAEGVLVPGTADKSVCTPSRNSNVAAKCYAKVAPPASGKAVKFSYANKPVACGSACSGSTTNWHEVVDALGNAVLTCNFK